MNIDEAQKFIERFQALVKPERVEVPSPDNFEQVLNYMVYRDLRERIVEFTQHVEKVRAAAELLSQSDETLERMAKMLDGALSYLDKQPMRDPAMGGAVAGATGTVVT